MLLEATAHVYDEWGDFYHEAQLTKWFYSLF
jgi:hypothetical protein